MRVVLFFTLVMSYFALNTTHIQYEGLKEVTQAPKLSLANQVFMGRIFRVIDGDSIRIIIPLFEDYYEYSFRVLGVDTPEIRSGNVRQFGRDVRDIVRSMLGTCIVKVEAGAFDKYGRPLGQIYFRDAHGEEWNLKDYLIDHQMGKPYDGGKKVPFIAEDYQSFQETYTHYQWPECVDMPYPISDIF